MRFTRTKIIANSASSYIAVILMKCLCIFAIELAELYLILNFLDIIA